MNSKLKAELARFKLEQKEALLSFDEAKIRAFTFKWNGTKGPIHPEAFWRGVHKAITAMTTLPLEVRQRSKAWLDAHGSPSLDDGDL
jgi:hypothetical protein